MEGRNDSLRVGDEAGVGATAEAHLAGTYTGTYTGWRQTI